LAGLLSGKMRKVLPPRLPSYGFRRTGVTCIPIPDDSRARVTCLWLTGCRRYFVNGRTLYSFVFVIAAINMFGDT